MIRTTLGIASLFALSLAACSQQPEDETNIIMDNEAAAGSLPSPSANESEPVAPATGNGGNTADNRSGNEADDNSEDSPPAVTIPAQYRGRWGMVPNDCTPGRSDAKGLIEIGDDRIKFYEAVAALQEQRPAIATSFSGFYVYNGEGQTWERVITLSRTGDSLKFAQADRTSTYQRCK